MAGFYRTVPQVDQAALDHCSVSRSGLLHHPRGTVNARDPPLRHQLGQELDANSGPKSNLEHPVTLLNIKEADHRASERGIGARHDDAAQLAEGTGRTPEHADQDFLAHPHRAYTPALVLPMPLLHRGGWSAWRTALTLQIGLNVLISDDRPIAVVGMRKRPPYRTGAGRVNSASIRISTSSPTPKLEPGGGMPSEIPNSERLSEPCAEKPMRAPNGSRGGPRSRH